MNKIRVSEYKWMIRSRGRVEKGYMFNYKKGRIVSYRRTSRYVTARRGRRRYVTYSEGITTNGPANIHITADQPCIVSLSLAIHL